MSKPLAHTHHFLLGAPAPNGTQLGRCVHCEEERVFRVDMSYWKSRTEEWERPQETIKQEVK
jgi:hypothetical protein